MSTSETEKQDKTKASAEETRLAQLTELAGSLGILVRVERGQFRSERCRRRDEELIILNKRLSTEDRVSVLAALLVREELEGIFMPPELRAFLGKVSENGAAS